MGFNWGQYQMLLGYRRKFHRGKDAKSIMNIFPCCKGWRTAVYYWSSLSHTKVSNSYRMRPSPNANSFLKVRVRTLKDKPLPELLLHPKPIKLLCLYNNDNRALWSTPFSFRFLWILCQINSNTIIWTKSRYMWSYSKPRSMGFTKTVQIRSWD